MAPLPTSHPFLGLDEHELADLHSSRLFALVYFSSLTLNTHLNCRSVATDSARAPSETELRESLVLLVNSIDPLPPPRSLDGFFCFDPFATIVFQCRNWTIGL